MASTPPPQVGSVRPSTLVADERGVLEVDGVRTIVLGVRPGTDDAPVLGPGVDADWAAGAGIPAALDLAATPTRPGTVTPVALPRDGGAARVLLAGLGDASPESCRRAGAAVGRALRGEDRAVADLADGLDDEALTALVEGFVLAPYAWRRAVTPGPSATPVAELVLAATGEARSAVLHRAAALARAGWLARELVVTPSDTKDPAWMADRAADVARSAGLHLRIRDERALAREGFGGILAVGQGSARPPRLVELTHDPGVAGAPHVVLVGKGITFDTGGLSLKPGQAMVPMKTDMSGSAVVLATMSALRDLGVAVKVTGLLALAENMPGAAAQRPGDVVRQYGGTTVEVVNTDAEGRLVLADALAYAVAELAPDALVDVATLTGAATLGLGRRHAALFATDDALAAALTAAGEAAGERLWRLPLVADYRDALRSEVADVCHVATDAPMGRVQGGAITAALFLERFTGGRPWAHLDIAGPGRADADEHEVTKGGTGFGARALLRWLSAPDPCGQRGRASA